MRKGTSLSGDPDALVKLDNEARDNLCGHALRYVLEAPPNRRRRVR